MEFNEQNSDTTLLGVRYIDKDKLHKFGAELGEIELIPKPWAKFQALVKFGIKCRSLSRPERAIFTGDYFTYGDLHEFCEKLKWILSISDQKAKMKEFLRFGVEIGILPESD